MKQARGACQRMHSAAAQCLVRFNYLAAENKLLHIDQFLDTYTLP